LLHKERKSMLTLTETASTVVKSIVDRDPTISDGALRIATGETSNDFAISVVSEPQPGDALIESHGAKVFVESGASTVLDDKTLDADVSEAGAITFALVPQS